MFFFCLGVTYSDHSEVILYYVYTAPDGFRASMKTIMKTLISTSFFVTERCCSTPVAKVDRHTFVLSVNRESNISYISISNFQGACIDCAFLNLRRRNFRVSTISYPVECQGRIKGRG